MMDYAAIYGQMHRKEKAFAGRSIRPYVKDIAVLVEETKPRRILDYGSGKGFQYLVLRVHEQWGGMLPHCYDVGVRQLREKPQGPFDGVICTDVMEHIDEPDVDAVLADIFSTIPPRDDAGTSFAFFSIACRPAARKLLPDGRNVHLTVREPAWWDAKLAAFKRDGLRIVARYDTESNS